MAITTIARMAYGTSKFLHHCTQITFQHHPSMQCSSDTINQSLNLLHTSILVAGAPPSQLFFMPSNKVTLDLEGNLDCGEHHEYQCIDRSDMSDF